MCTFALKVDKIKVIFKRKPQKFMLNTSLLNSQTLVYSNKNVAVLAILRKLLFLVKAAIFDGR